MGLDAAQRRFHSITHVHTHMQAITFFLTGRESEEDARYEGGVTLCMTMKPET